MAQPRELSEDAVLKTKFTLSVQTMIAAGTGLASLIGMWYALQADIQEAKELPSLETLYNQMNIHQDQRDIIGQGLMNNIKIKWVHFKKIWMMFLIS